MTDKSSQKFFTTESLKALWHYAWHHVAWPYTLEYAACVLFTEVINLAWFHGRLNPFLAAFGVLATGGAYRYFHLSAQPKRHVPDFQLVEVPGLTIPHADQEADSKLSGPYL